MYSYNTWITSSNYWFSASDASWSTWHGMRSTPPNKKKKTATSFSWSYVFPLLKFSFLKLLSLLQSALWQVLDKRRESKHCIRTSLKVRVRKTKEGINFLLLSTFFCETKEPENYWCFWVRMKYSSHDIWIDIELPHLYQWWYRNKQNKGCKLNAWQK